MVSSTKVTDKGESMSFLTKIEPETYIKKIETYKQFAIIFKFYTKFYLISFSFVVSGSVWLRTRVLVRRTKRERSERQG